MDTRGRNVTDTLKISSQISGHCGERADSLKPIQWASDNGNVLFHYVCIDLGSLHIGVTHQFLNAPNVSPIFKQVGAKTMALRA